MLKAKFRKYQLHFKQPAGTSRGVYTTRDSWFISLWHDEEPERIGYGECAPLPDLSCDFGPAYEDKIKEVCADVDNLFYWLSEGLLAYPSILFGLESALMDLQNKGQHILYDTPFVHQQKGLKINGLIWMGEAEVMRRQIEQKLDQGFSCIKLKIGAIDTSEELAILRHLRQEFPAEILELRVDANGAFDTQEALPLMEQLAALQIHSIEQPIPAGQIKNMKYLCKHSPLAIALDEELIGVHTRDEKETLIKRIKPQYIILKPSLHGGLSGCEEWIEVAEEYQVAWWITSALESNIGLNAIAQWTASLDTHMAQGLGTGQLFTNNIPSPLCIKGEELWYAEGQAWDLSVLNDG